MSFFITRLRSNMRLRIRGNAVLAGRSVFLAAAVGAALLAAPGCNQRTPAPSGAHTVSGDSGKRATADQGSQRCQTLLSSGLEMIKPANLSISAEPKFAVDVLNNWVRECGRGIDPPPPDELANQQFSASEREAAASDLYELRDVEHVRDCWLFKRSGASVVASHPDERDRIVALFDHAVRLVALPNPGESLGPQTAYEIAVTGKGTVEDRAWIFGELLRQIGLDAVILRPRPRAGGARELPWLVGVILDKQVYLFDPALGWPVPAADDPAEGPSVRRAATLAQAAANDALLRKLDVSPEKPYPLRSEDLKSLKVELITSDRYWLPRIRRLEPFLSGERSVTITAPLGDQGDRAGLLSRVAAAGAGFWKKEDVTVWPYPRLQSTAAHAPDAEAAQVRRARWLPFEAPVKVSFDTEKMEPVVTAGDLSQIKGRVDQLEGDPAGAIRTYLLIQLDELPPQMRLTEQERAALMKQPGKAPANAVAYQVPQRALLINYRAAEDAKFWMAVCQLDQNESATAAETLDAYLRRYSQGDGGNWVIHAQMLRGLLAARLQQYALAVQTANVLARALPETDPRRHACELFAARWRAARDSADKRADAGSAPSPPASAQGTTPPPQAAAAASPAADPPPREAAVAPRPQIGSAP
jgi:hypothetical protein